MSELFELMGQASGVAETAKDAMKGHAQVADKTTEKLARAILDEAKRLLPENRIVQVLSFETSELDWSSVRSVMQATSNALSSENLSRANRRGPAIAIGGGPNSWMR
jgi:hypothetical protein